jgi:hypothetical protein
MEPAFTGTSFNSSEHEHINCVRMHLQVATLPNISDGNGQTINQDIMAGQRPTDRQSPRVWPRQPSVTSEVPSQSMGEISTDTLCNHRRSLSSTFSWTMDK